MCLGNPTLGPYKDSINKSLTKYPAVENLINLLNNEHVLLLHNIT